MDINTFTSLKPGTILNNGDRKYRIVKALGQGGFGITYLAVGEIKVGNVTTEANFAIKEHFPTCFCYRNGNFTYPKEGQYEAFDKSKIDFISESRKLHILGTQNKNIVKVNEAFEENGTAYYVMQYINGESLASYVSTKGKLSFGEAIQLLSPIINAVAFLHESRINHLDIKPENIMLHDGIDGKTPILIDFGLSIRFKKSGEKTSPKSIMGVSAGYSPFEQYAGISEFSPQSDIYSIAATLLFTITGSTPPEASTLNISETRKAIKEIVPSDALDGLCKALSKYPTERTSDIGIFKSGLGLYNSENGQTLTEVLTPNRRNAKTKTITISIIVVAVTFGGIASAIFSSKSSSSTGLTVIDSTPTVLTETPDTTVSTIIAPITSFVETTEVQPSPQAIADEPSGDTNNMPSTTIATSQQSSGGNISLGYATWKGNVKNGKPDGSGRLTFTERHRVDRSSSQEANPGDYFIATYDAGYLISGKLYDSDGNLISTIIP